MLSNANPVGAVQYSLDIIIDPLALPAVRGQCADEVALGEVSLRRFDGDSPLQLRCSRQEDYARERLGVPVRLMLSFTALARGLAKLERCVGESGFDSAADTFKIESIVPALAAEPPTPFEVRLLRTHLQRSAHDASPGSAIDPDGRGPTRARRRAERPEQLEREPHGKRTSRTVQRARRNGSGGRPRPSRRSCTRSRPRAAACAPPPNRCRNPPARPPFPPARHRGPRPFAHRNVR